MDDFYSYPVRLRDGDANMYGVLRISRLFEILQEAAGLHSVKLGIDRAITIKRGYVWMITTQRADIIALPRRGESVTVETWTGKLRFGLYPRYYRMLNSEGSELLTCSSNWVLVHEINRTLGTPEETGISYTASESMPALKNATAPRRIPSAVVSEFTVPYSYCDINRHMNNTRYFDIAEDICPDFFREKTPKCVSSEYRKEIKPGEKVNISFGTEEKSFFVSGETSENAFRIRFDYL